MLMKAQFTLAKIDQFLQESADLGPTRMRDLRSAIRVVARCVGRDPEHIPAQVPELRRALDSLHPADFKISRKRWQNIRSDLIAAIRLVNETIPSMRVELSAEWQALYDRLKDKRFKCGLSGLIHYASAKGINSDEISDASVLDYLSYVSEETLRKNPQDKHRLTCRLWNEAAHKIADWPQVTLTVPDYRKPGYTFPWKKYPASFQADLKAHLKWLEGSDFLSRKPPPRRCKPSTIALRERHLAVLSASAIHQGVAGERLLCLANLVAKETAEAALTHQLQRHGNQPTGFVRDLAKTLYSVAHHGVDAPDALVSWYRDILRRLKAPTQGLTTKNRETLRQFESVENKRRILRLPEHLADKALTQRGPAQRKAVLIQIALAIEVLLVAPMRIGNLVALRLDRHIQYTRGKGRPVHIVVHEREIKNGIPLEFPLPQSTCVILDQYVQHYRQVLAPNDTPWLFPGTGASHKSATTLAQQIKETIFRETGLRMTPHQFRHLAAKLYLDAHPGSYELVRRVLGHKSIKTTTNFYCGFETRAAIKQFDDVILELRKDRGSC